MTAAPDPISRTRWGAFASAPVALAVLLVALAAVGAAAPTLLADPGAVVRWGLPIVELLVQGATLVTIGALALCAVILPRVRAGSRRGARPTDDAAWVRAQRTAAIASVVWVVAGALQLVLTYASVSGRALTEPTFSQELGIFLTQIALGQMLLWGLVLSAVTALAAVAATRPGGAVGALLLACVALVPMAATGHSAGAANHTLAVGSIYLHVVAVTLWVGGLVVLALVAPLVGRALPDVAARYSHLALWCYALVGVSGVLNAYVRVGDLAALATPYGALLLAKVVATIGLGAMGWWHRRRTIPRLTTGRTWPFWRLVLGEVVLMGAVMGLAVALSNTAPPVPDEPLVDLSPAEQITGLPVPGEPTLVGWVFGFQPEALTFIGILCAAVVVVTWLVRLRRRVDVWPVGRVVSILVGLGLLMWTTSGGAAVYGHILFSAHMVQHMVLVMLAPIFLVLGAPVTLALRALPARTDGSLGPRELLLALVHSRWAGFFAHPVVAAVNVAGSMIVFYYTPLFELSLSNHLVHLWMVVHFTLAGYMFVNVLVGIDPGPKRPSFPLRLLLLFATMAFHAFFGLSLTMGDQLLAARWFGALGLPWGVDALADQRWGGAFAWGFGEIPSLALAIALGLAWIRDDTRAARRLDRKADRDGDADLVAYNARLAAMAERDSGR